MRVTEATAQNINSVAERMRERDLAEFSATSFFSDREGAAVTLVERYAGLENLECATLDDGTPVAIGGVLWLRPNVASILFFATDDFERIVVPLTRHVRRNVIATAKDVGAHRIECMSLASYTQMRSWVEVFGLREEARLRAYGKNGEDFISYAWVENQE